MSMGKSKIGYYTIGPDGTPTHEYRVWNPIGMGCSGGCPRCWARGVARRQSKKGCQDCLHFRVHIHRERLDQVADRKTPSLVLGNFTGDWMDKERSGGEIAAILTAMSLAHHHEYITLTKNAARMAEWLGDQEPSDNWWLGLTIRNQAEADAKLPAFLSVPGNLWVSFEPAEWEVNWRRRFAHSIRCLSYRGREGFTGPACDCGAPHVKGIIVGQNNSFGAPGTETLAHVKSTVEQCTAAGVACFVKQIWVEICPLCDHPEKVRQVGKRRLCSPCGRQVRWRLLRASHPDEYALYPDWARHNTLPWQPSGIPG